MSLEIFASSLADLLDPPPRARRWATPGQMAAELDPTTVQTPALDLIDQALVDLADDRCMRLAIFMSPQEGKSERASHWFPLWMLADVDPDLRIAIVSHSDELARGWGSVIKGNVETFNGFEGTVDLGLRLKTDSRAAGRWNVEGQRGGVYCTSVSGSLTGRPVDLLIIDDPIANLEKANSITYRERAHRFWQGVAIPRMGPRTKTVLIQTRWHEDDLAGRLLATEGRADQGGRWRVVSIPAQCEDEKTDPLRRRAGEYMVSARGRTAADWDQRKADSGSYVWSALYQQHPSPAEGGLFKRLWWRHWQPAGSRRLLVGGGFVDLRDCWRFGTVDLAASMKTGADWTVAAAWALTLSGDLILLDLKRAHVDERRHFDLVRPLATAWELDTTYVERSQYGTTLASDATREGIHLTPLTADVDKLTRAIPASARAEGGRIWLPPKTSADWVGTFIDECAGFPSASHDDQVDVLAYAVRVAVTKPAPQLRPPDKPSDEINFMSVPL